MRYLQFLLDSAEDQAGGATDGQANYVRKALELLRSRPDVEWIQAEACCALASMTNSLSIRKQLDRENPDWLEDIVGAMTRTRSVKQVVKEIGPGGTESRYAPNYSSCERYS